MTERQATPEERRLMVTFGEVRDSREQYERILESVRACEERARDKLTAMLITGEVLSCPEGKARLQDDGRMVFGWTRAVGVPKGKP